MMMFIEKLRYMIPGKKSSYYYVNFLRKNGIKIGQGTYFVSPRSSWIDITKKGMISIGDNCCFSGKTMVLAHDYSYSVMTRKYGEIVGKQKFTKIGNNVFIGTNTIILMGATIGDNVIIGAGSVVSGYIEDNSVYAGNPAKKIRSLDSHLEILKQSYEKNARLYIKDYADYYGVMPTIGDMDVYKPLFVEKTDEMMNRYFASTNDFTKKAIMKTDKKFSSVSEAIKSE